MLEEEIQNQENHVESVDSFIRLAKKHLYLEKLTPAVLNDMVKAVYIHAPDKSNGHRVQDVDISYNYIGILPANYSMTFKTEKRHDRNHAVSRKLIYCFIEPLPTAVLFYSGRFIYPDLFCLHSAASLHELSEEVRTV